MVYIVIAAIWFVVSVSYGALGMGVGPGAVMIFCGMILGLSGSIIHFLVYAYNVELKWYYAGLVISLASVLLTIIIIGGDTTETEILIFLWVFYAIPSHLIYIVISMLPGLKKRKVA